MCLSSPTTAPATRWWPTGWRRPSRAMARQGKPIRAVMLSRLGPNVWHDSLAAAMAVLEELEETAKLVHLSPTPPEPLTESQINDLRQTFGARW
jgi:ribulose-5-phosphate 4-epimerase/fuculose-1-phosphate aldolase